jgi:chromosome segregation ATPase
MRDKAKGEQIAEITPLAGRTFRHVAVREVTPIGMQIRHDDGFTRIPYEDLPHALQERFQFDPQEKREAVKAESSSEQVHLNNVADSDAAGQVLAIVNREKQNQEDKQKAISQIALLVAQIKAIDGDIADLQIQFVRAKAKAAAGKAAGHRVLDGSSSVHYSIEAKRNQRAEVQDEIQSIRSKL